MSPHLSRGREQFLCCPRHYLSLPYHTSGFTPTPSLLTTGLSFWGCHINRTIFLIAFGSSSQVKSGTTIFKERWAGSWEGKEASITTAISLLCRDSPWDKLLHEYLGSSDDNCQEWEKWASMWYTGWERCCLAPQRPAKKLSAHHCSRAGFPGRACEWRRQGPLSATFPCQMQAGLGSEGQNAELFSRNRGKMSSEMGLFDPLSLSPLPVLIPRWMLEVQSEMGKGISLFREVKCQEMHPVTNETSPCARDLGITYLIPMCWNLEADELVFKYTYIIIFSV